MTRLIIKELVFDENNISHIARHKVTKEEATEAGKRMIYHSPTYNSRYVAVGRVGMRIIALIITRVGQGRYYLITARDASKKERKYLYEKENKNNPKI